MRDGKNSPLNDALLKVPVEGRKGETFTWEHPYGSVGYVARTPEEQRRERADWLSGVGPPPTTQEVKKDDWKSKGKVLGSYRA